MGLRELVLQDLKMRGVTSWNVKAPQGTPNRKAAAKLARRQRGYVSRSPAGHDRKMPGSYNRKRG